MNYNTINVTVIGGGTGMPPFLTGLDSLSSCKTTGIVAATDDGGSSGDISDKYKIIPIGDMVKCYNALAHHSEGLQKFLRGRPDIHSKGNRLLKDFILEYGVIKGLQKYSEGINTRTVILPCTIHRTNLCAKFKNGNIITGETAIDAVLRERFEIKKLFLQPKVDGCAEAIQAINNADAICIAPGSLYTSVLPNFLPRGIAKAIKKSKAPIIYVCNLVTEGWGMLNFKVSTMIKIIESYIGRKITKVIANSYIPNDAVLGRYKGERKFPLEIDHANINPSILIEKELWTDDEHARHDPNLSAETVFAAIAICVYGARC